jgi:hypothetical protein
LRSIQKTVLDDQYGLPHQVSCGSFLPVPFEDNIQDLGDSEVAIIGSQQNLSRSCTVMHSTRERVVTVHRYPQILSFLVKRDGNNRRSIESIQSINFDSIEKVLFFGGVTYNLAGAILGNGGHFVSILLHQKEWLTHRDGPSCQHSYLYDGLSNPLLRRIDPDQTISECVGSSYTISHLWYTRNESTYQELINATGLKNSVADNVPVINDNNVSSDNDQTNTTQKSDMCKNTKHSKKRKQCKDSN